MLGNQSFRDLISSGNTKYLRKAILGTETRTKNQSTGKITKSFKEEMTLLNPDIVTGGWQLTSATTNPSTFEIGSCITRSFICTFYNRDYKYDAYEFKGKRVDVYNGLDDGSASGYYFKVGQYTVIDAVSQANTIILTCYDDLRYTMVDFETINLSYPTTFGDIVNAIAEQTLGSSVVGFTSSDPFYNREVKSDFFYQQGTTCAMVLQYIAQCCGYFVRTDPDGNIEFAWYKTFELEPNQVLPPTTEITDSGDMLDGNKDNADGGSLANYASGDTYNGGNFKQYYTIKGSSGAGKDNYIYSNKSPNYHYFTESHTVAHSINNKEQQITGVKVETAIMETVMAMALDGEPEETKQAVPYTALSGDESGYVVGIANNPFASDPTSASDVANHLNSKLNGVSFRPMTVTTLANPGIQAGDGIAFTDQRGNTYVGYATSVDYVVGQQAVITCDADDDETQKMTKENVSHVVSEKVNERNNLIELIEVVGIRWDWAEGGTLTLGGYNNQSGQMVVLDENGNEIMYIGADGFRTTFTTKNEYGEYEETEGTLQEMVQSSIDQSADQITMTVTNTVMDSVSGEIVREVSSQIQQTAESITSTVTERVNATVDSKIQSEVTSQISQTKDEIKLEVKEELESGISDEVSDQINKIKAIETILTQYAISSSRTTAPTETSSDWKDSFINTTDAKPFLWKRTKVTYIDDSVEYIGIECLSASEGKDGNSIEEINNYYALGNSNTEAPVSGWTTSPQTPTSSQKYLWNYEEFIMTDGEPITTTPHVVSVYTESGGAGKGIDSIDEYYLASALSTGVTRSTSGWTKSFQEMSESKPYLWNYETTNWSDGTSSSTDPIIIGHYGKDGSKGDTGTGITSITEHYLIHQNRTGITTSTSGWSTDVQLPTEEKRFLWNYETILYTDGNSVDSQPAVIGYYSKDGKGITNIQEFYLASASSTGITNTTSGFTETPQTVTKDKKYLWNYELITYTDDTTKKTEAIVIGVFGETGVGVSSITEHYLASSSGTGVTTSNSGWTTTVQTVDETKKYLWNYETVLYTDGNSVNTVPAIIGMYSKDGKGIDAVTEYYLASASSSGVTNATSGFTTTIQSISDTKPYLWNYEYIAYTDGSNKKTNAVIIGHYGKDGDKGDTGTGITNVETLHYLKYSTSATPQNDKPSLPTSKVTSTADTHSTWTLAEPTYITNYYYWTCLQITYSDGNTKWSDLTFCGGYTTIIKQTEKKTADIDIKLGEIASTVTDRVYAERANTVTILRGGYGYYDASYKPEKYNDTYNLGWTSRSKTYADDPTYYDATGNEEHGYARFKIKQTTTNSNYGWGIPIDIKDKRMVSGAEYTVSMRARSSVASPTIRTSVWYISTTDNSTMSAVALPERKVTMTANTWTTISFVVSVSNSYFKDTKDMYFGLKANTLDSTSATFDIEWIQVEPKVSTPTTFYGEGETVGEYLKDDMSKIIQLANSIESVVQSGNEQSVMIQDASTFYFNSNNFVVDSDNFKVSKDGTIESKAGKIGGFTIGTTGLYNGGTSELWSENDGVYVGTDGFSMVSNNKQLVIEDSGMMFDKLGLTGANSEYVDISYTGFSIKSGSKSAGLSASTGLVLTDTDKTQYGIFTNGLIKYKDVNITTPWTNATLASGFTGASYLNSDSTVKYRKIGDRVYIQGAFTCSNAISSTTTVFTLPSGLRPTTNFYHYAEAASTGYIARMIVSNNGNVRIINFTRIATGSNISAGTIDTSTTGLFVILNFSFEIL